MPLSFLVCFLMWLLNATLCNNKCICITILTWKPVNLTGLLKQNGYLSPLSSLNLVGDGIHCWGKGAHAGTEMWAGIDHSTQAALWSGHVLVVFPVFTILFSHLFLPGSWGQEVLSFLVLAMMSWAAERRWLEGPLGQLSARGHSWSGHSGALGTPGALGPPKCVNSHCCLKAHGPVYGHRGGVASRSWGIPGGMLCLPPTHRQDMVEGEHAQLSPSLRVFAGNH